MATRRKHQKSKDDTSIEAASTRSGGVNIDAKDVSVGGDVVGRDKIVGYSAAQVQAVLAQISTSFQPKAFDGRCPYVGLGTFQEEDADRFFGRERLVTDLLGRVKESRFIMVAGPSGSGKSSLVRAGLLHALKSGALPDSQRWLYETLKPGRAPLEELARAASGLARTLNAGADIRGRGLADPSVLHQWAEVALGDGRDRRAILFIDQFEEMFTQVAKEEERLAFLNLFTHAVAVESGRVTLICAMRSDFVSNCATYPQLNALLSQQFIQIGAMQPDELVSAIARPALEVRLRVDPDLIAQIVNDMQDEPGALPLMQFTLQDLFAAQQAKGGVIALTLADYLARGGLRKALERHADSAFAGLSDAEQQLARSIFGGLIEIGLGTQDTRRTALFDELIPAGASPADVMRIVQKLADARLITTDEQDDRDTVTISHEKLIDAWPWLRKLVNENREAIALQNQIAEDALEWETSQRDPSYLYVGARLAGALEQLAAKAIVLSGPAQAFVAAGMEAEAAERRQEEARRQKELDDARRLAEAERLRAEEQARSAAKLRQRALYLIGALGVALVLGIVAGIFGIQSYQAANEAQQQASIARSRQLAAQAVVQAETDPGLALLLARESSNVQNRLGLSDTLEIKSSLLTSMLSGPRPLKYLRGHSQPVLKVAFSPDSQWIASASTDGTVRVWSVLSRQSVYTLTDHAGAVNSVDFASTSNPMLLASGGADGTVRLWTWEQADTPPSSVVLPQFHGQVRAVAFSPTEPKLAVAGDDQVVRLFDVDSGQLVNELTGHTGSIYGLAFSHAGTMLASTDSHNVLRFWDVMTGEAMNQPDLNLSPNAEASMLSVTFRPTDDYVITGVGNGLGYAAVGDDEATPYAFVPHTSKIRGVAYSHDGTRFASASEDWRVGYCYVLGFDCEDVLFLKGHGSPVNSVAFSPDDRWLASGGDDGNVLLWNARFPFVSRSLPAPIYFDNRRWNVEGLVFSPDSQTLVSSNWDGAIRLWDVESRDFEEFWPGQGTLGVIAISPDGKQLAFSADSPPHYIWAIDGSMQATLPITTPVAGVAFSPNGRWLVTDHYGLEGICLWELSNLQPACPALSNDGVTTRFAFSPDSRLLASNGGTGTSAVRVWDLSVQPPISRTLGSHDGGIFGLAFSPNGKLLASAGGDYTIRIWDVTVADSAPIVLRYSGRFARSVAFSPDGQMLVSVNEDWTVRWWDIKTGQPLVTPVQVRYDRIDSVAFSPDGKWLATGSFDGIIDLWPGNLEEWKQLACRIVNRNLTQEEWVFYLGSQEPYDQTCEQ